MISSANAVIPSWRISGSLVLNLVREDIACGKPVAVIDEDKVAFYILQLVLGTTRWQEPGNSTSMQRKIQRWIR